MRITGLRTGVVGTPWRHLTFVEVQTDEGLTGVGETRMIGHTDALLGYLAEAERDHIRGSDPFEIESLVQRMVRIDYGRSGEIAMAACTPNFKIQEHFNDFADPWVLDIAPGLPAVDPDDGCFPVPTAPGLGVTIDCDAVAEHPREDVHFNLFAPGWERRDVRRAAPAPVEGPTA